MKIVGICFSGKEFKELPKEIATAFVQFGHFSNELTFFFRLLNICIRTPATQEVERAASSFHLLMVTRLLAGKLAEGWKMVQRTFYGSKVSREFESLFSESETESLSMLKDYFGKGNILKNIRNEFSFHYGSDEIQNQIQDVEDEYRFHVYQSLGRASSFNGYAEDLVANSLLRVIPGPDSAARLKILIQDVVLVSENFQVFSGAVLENIARKYLSQCLAGSEIEEIELPNIARLSQLQFPFFYEVDS